MKGGDDHPLELEIEPIDGKLSDDALDALAALLVGAALNEESQDETKEARPAAVTIKEYF